eukprot:2162065-Pleurochrysis_carterae.AAC.1
MPLVCAALCSAVLTTSLARRALVAALHSAAAASALSFKIVASRSARSLRNLSHSSRMLRTKRACAT